MVVLIRFYVMLQASSQTMIYRCWCWSGSLLQTTVETNIKLATSW